ncbi:MAG: carboxypeptidase-like regulatory domain-containing protein, partial [Paramuribaculum sp.]|nr:carboxypeptidase-like regulatory domain-containing protein [Paramuribaculum sp.]
MRLYTLLLFICGLAAAVHAEINISGKVTDTESQPVEFASVRVAGTAIGANTDEKGAYKLSVSDRDTLVLIYACIGYEEVKRTLVKPSGNLTINVRLQTRSNELEGVTVTEIRRQTGTMQTMTVSNYRLAAEASGGNL